MMVFKIIKKFLVVIIVVFLLKTTTLQSIGVENNSTIMTSGTYDKGFRYNIQGWIYIHIEGEPYERGYQYGYLASAEIVDMINRWSNFAHTEDFMKIFVIKQLPQNYDELSKTYWNLCKNRGIKLFWDQYPEEYQKEIKGIADGVRARGGTVHGHLVDYKDIFTLNVIEETREICSNPGGRGRPFKTLFNQLKSGLGYLFKSSEKEEYQIGHCTAFIATGNATVDGRIVAAHSLVIANYLAQRTNLILDVQPSKGHRFVMTCFPGYIWSSEDYHQNDCGIILMETSLWPPFGPWKVKGNIPVGVRVRKAIQYSDSIDNVKQILLDGNNGLYPCDWIMGDIKTGEIASLELGLYNHAWTKTDNGFLWSCCNTKDDKVRWGLWSVFKFGAIGRIIRNKFTPSSIDKKFEELGNIYYGNIDVDIIKKIMATEPICTLTTDCKITDSQLMKNLGLWAYIGRPDGFHWKPTPELEKNLKGIKETPGTGWLKLYASRSQYKDLPDNNAQNNAKKNSKIVWTYQTENTKNIDYASCIVSDGVLNVATSTGKIYSLDSRNGRLRWENNISEKSVTPAASDDLVFIGSMEGLYVFDKESGIIKWEQLVGGITSKPFVSNDIVIASCSNGDIYLFDKNSGEQLWSYKFPEVAVISDTNDDTVYIASGDTCYKFNFREKEIKWQYKTDSVITASPSLRNDIVYVGSWDGNLYAVDSITGDLRWKFETGWGVDTTPANSNGKVYFGSTDNNFYCLNEEDGRLIWYFNCKAAIHSSPVVYGEYVIFGSDDGRLYALNKINGDLEWSYAPGYSINNDDVNNYITTPILSDPVVENSIVYISAKGTIYALDAQTTDIPKENYSEKTDQNNDFVSLIIFLLLFLLGIALLIRTYLKKKNNNR